MPYATNEDTFENKTFSSTVSESRQTKSKRTWDSKQGEQLQAAIGNTNKASNEYISHTSKVLEKYNQSRQ